MGCKLILTVYVESTVEITDNTGQICSTWGNFHFKTFDGDVFYFPGLCNYLFASHCSSTYEEFNIQIRRSVVNSIPVISRVLLMIEGAVIEIKNDSIKCDGAIVQLPYSLSGIQIVRSGMYVKITAKLGLVFMWNEADSIQLELNYKYANQTCGLCGDFNSITNELISNNAKLTATKFGNLQKLDGPKGVCEDPKQPSQENCRDIANTCKAILKGPAFSNCNVLVDVTPYVEACNLDLCLCRKNAISFCLCNTFAEYSRHCAQAGGRPEDWRTQDLCPKLCPFNMEYQECGSPCADTCSHPERTLICEEHCIDGCFCPQDTVFDDINNSGCIPHHKCYCTFSGKAYAPGASYTTACSICTCFRGQWSCKDIICHATCSVEGGSHITSYDDNRYTVHGECNYILSKVCKNNTFIVLGELRRCGLRDSETCLRSITLILNTQTVSAQDIHGSVLLNSIYTNLPISAANAILFRPSSFFIIVQTSLGLQLQVQLVPIMQVYLILDPAYRRHTCGLCGNYNSMQADDFVAMSGIVEGTAAAFANTWKAQADCPDIKNIFADPCALSVENENYAQQWCSMLMDAEGPFAYCHNMVNPAVYYKNCMFDTCNCAKSEDCMCAALSSYVRACTDKGVSLSGWRTEVCSTYVMNCPRSLVYSYNVSSCQPTCRSLNEPDVVCDIEFSPVDGCVCKEGTYMDGDGKCLLPSFCPCYYKGHSVPPGEIIHENNGMTCTCINGRLICAGHDTPKPNCTAPMYYFNCSNAPINSRGSECQKSCQTLNIGCYGSQCISGCLCPKGLVTDGLGGCIPPDECPCIHNEIVYQPGEQIRIQCNTCICKNRIWKCTKEMCLGTCAVYGEGNYITFDSKNYRFSGDCEYTLVQDYCGTHPITGTFRVIIENVPCGTTGTTCSKSIKIFLRSYKLLLSNQEVEVLESSREEAPFKIHQMGIYVVIEINIGLIVIWDKKTGVFIKLTSGFKGKVCGLCGNFEGNAINDFTTRNHAVVRNVLEFGNSWKLSPNCPDAKDIRNPCTVNPYRKSWAQKQCSLITSEVFAACHSQVDPIKYYSACVMDACACDTGGDCECFCTAVASYAQACNEAGVCIAWRTPAICPLFCDYYNEEGDCKWHYKPCGAPCMKTCRNPSGRCLYKLPGLEGCYPSCPKGKPYFDEEEMKCVAQCGCYDDEGHYYKQGERVPSCENCQSCVCGRRGIDCNYDTEACYCDYEGKMYEYNEIIYHLKDGMGGCINATCGVNGTINRVVYACFATLTTTAGDSDVSESRRLSVAPASPRTASSDSSHGSSIPLRTWASIGPLSEPGVEASIFSLSRALLFRPECGIAEMPSKPCIHELCQWTKWYDVSYPQPRLGSGDFETFQNIMAKGYPVCQAPRDVKCRSVSFPDKPLDQLNQKVDCNKQHGLICRNRDQYPPICLNYEIQILCCSDVPCGTTIPTSITQTTFSASTMCDVQCKWTAWFDVDSPSPGVPGGDFETYNNLITAGKPICRNPEHIQCRAKNFPDISFDKIGQIVQCDISFGLMCKNEEQPGRNKLCYDYEIRLLCCDDSIHCKTTTPSATVTIPAVTSTPCIHELCQWTKWYDVSYPQSRLGSGDFETFENITAKGYPICQSPRDVKCRSVSFPDKPLDQLNQKVDCNKQHGLICRNRDQYPPICLNYEIQILCCSDVPCGTTIPTSITQTTFSASTMCDVQCKWTAWFDVDSPSPGITGGDYETYNNLIAARKPICRNPEQIQCRAKNFPDISLDKIGQIVWCDISFGLMCKNQEQPGRNKLCYDYEIRLLCCDDSIHCKTTTPSATVTTPSATVTTPEVTSTPCIHELCQWTKWYDVSYPQPRLGSGDFETFENITAKGYPICQSPRDVKCRSVSFPDKPLDQLNQKVDCNKQHGLICRNRDQYPPICLNYEIQILCCSDVPCGTTIPTSITETTIIASTMCDIQCKWTAWFDVDSPSPGITGGDYETYNNLITAGKPICRNPEQIQCRAKNFPDISLEKIGQIVWCDISFGLMCKNQEQPGRNKLCYDYEIRLWCCDDSIHCKTTTPSATVTTPEVTSTPCIHELCQWTKWYDVNYPQPLLGSGDFETFENITAKGYPICQSPRDVKCRSVSFPDKTLDQLNQKVDCNKQHGLICLNRDQYPPICLNYEIQILCCSDVPCGTTIPTSITQTTFSASTMCDVQCKWTAWFDVDSPSPGITGGDYETYNNLIAARKPICRNPEQIQCRAKNFPDISLDKIGQIVWCDISFGLMCKNQEQPGRNKLCYDYEIRLLCCDDSIHCKTTTPSATVSTPSATVTTPAVTSTPCIHELCQWTKWYDVSYPQPRLGSGDFETFENITAKGYPICQSPRDVKCRSVSFPNKPLDQLNQKVDCNKQHGLICRNRDQYPPICLNYEIQILCCSDVPCGTTIPTSITQTTFSASTMCDVQCKWTAWFDVDSPSPGITGGDYETYNNLKAAGKPICQNPEHIQCRAKNFPDISLDKIGQIVQCDISFGLMCKNEQQPGRNKLCYDYEIRLLCCDDSIHCKTTTPSATVTTPAITKTPCIHELCQWTKWYDISYPQPRLGSGDFETFENITAKGYPICQSPRDVKCRSVSFPDKPLDQLNQKVDCNKQHGLICRNRDQYPPICLNYEIQILCCSDVPCGTTIPTSITETTFSASTMCDVQCKWTAWFDVDSPSPGITGGDYETYNNLITAGKPICRNPEQIQCRAKNFPDITLDKIGQIVWCDISFGLMCKNQEQPGRNKLCYDYEIRLLCCDDSIHCKTTTPSATVSTPSATVTTPAVTSTPCIHELCQWTKWYDVSYPQPRLGSGDFETFENITAKGYPICQSPRDIKCRSVSFPDKPLDQLNQKVDCNKQHGLICQNRDQYPPICLNYEIQILCCSDVPCGTTIPTSITQTTFSASTMCDVQCKWTAWFDVDSPSPGITGGDYETYNNLIAAGKPICRNPEHIQCRAKNFPDISLDKIGQIVRCDISFGLMCKNEQQPGRNKLCYDYEIRLLCCDDSIHCKTTTPSATVTTPAVTKTPCIHELCQWTKWYDISYPQPRLGSGDFETFENITAKGYPICQSPRDVKCRSVSFPDKTLDQLNQKVDCNKQHGLICRNRDQYPPICLNYEIQILCCSDVPCGTTIPTSITQTTFSASTMCDVQCKWTAWFDVDSPSPGITGGDYETYNNLKAAGKPICRNPEHIQCRAKNFPDISLDKIGQIVQCDISFGLMCKNEQQPGRNKLCYDYEIRLLCCDDSIHCKTTTPSATVTTPAITKTPCIHELCQWTKWYDISYPQPRLGSGDFETFENITAKGYPICQSPRDVKCRSVSFPDKPLDQLNQKVDCNKQHGLICRNRDQYPPICLNYEIQILCCSDVPCGTTIPTSITETTFSASTMCDVQCKWTAWFDVDSPSPGITGGDYETYNNLITAGKPICRNPEQIQCRAKNFPDISLDKIGQIVWCDISFGLMCKNQEQPGRNKLCYDYEIRLLCCDDSIHCKTTTPSATVSTPSATVTTPAVTSTPCIHELCQWTKWYDVSYPQPRLGSGDFETFENITAKGYPICQSPRDIKCRSVSFPDKPLDQLNQKVDCNKQHGLICQNRDQYPPICLNYEIQILCCSDVPCGTTIPTSITQTTFSASTMCDVQCKWTAWFDVDSPSPGITGGDYETYNNLIAAGKPICRNPEHIQCRAKNFPDISLDKIGQIVRCDISFGLMCKNEQQPGRNKLCYDYEIRLLCCDDSIHCKTTTPSATVTTPAVTKTPCIHELCQWTKWYDISYPQPRLGSGDFETFENITAKGYPICQSPRDVKCRSVSFPDKTLDQLNQKVDCNKQHGLICRNRDQYPPICLNYEIQILCCSDVPCGTTIPTSITETTFSASTMCDVQCKWTAWFDVDSPSPGITGGDYETYNNLITAGKPICRNPEQIQCRAKNFPDISLEKIGQIVWCDISFGLMCKNQEQPGRNKLCYDYEIKLLCCDDSIHCKTTTPSATVTTPAVTSTPCIHELCQWTKWYDVNYPQPRLGSGDFETFENITAKGYPICQSPRDVKCRSVSFPYKTLDQLNQKVDCNKQHGLICRNRDQYPPICLNYEIQILCCSDVPCGTTIPTSITQTTFSASTMCDVQCKWTAWFNVDSPSPGVPGGDFETYNNLITAGKLICRNPEHIQCRAKNFADISLDKIGQIVRCDISFGLMCKNEEQSGRNKLCYDYEIRLLCCDDSIHCKTTTPSATVTTPAATSTPCIHELCQWTKWYDVSYPQPRLGSGDFETFENITAKGYPICQSPRDVKCRSVSFPDKSLDQLNQKVDCNKQNGLICRNRDQYPPICLNYEIQILCCSDVPCGTTIPTSITQTTFSASTVCDIQCKWTAWFDVDSPSPGVPGGDFETYNNLITAGKPICRNPEHIQCRAKNFPDISLDKIGQIVRCDISFGLMCKNEEQLGRNKLCYDYEIRLLCCDDSIHCKTTTPSATVTTPAVTSTPCIHELCQWTKWYDVSYPEPRLGSGDFETFENIPAKGYPICKSPRDVKCRSVSFPDKPLDQLNQKVDCNKQHGLICRNRDQYPPICLNYEIQILCCSDVPCGTTIPTSITETTFSASTMCDVQCKWTAWFDVDSPSPGITGGDYETYNNLITAGKPICRNPEQIQCRAKNFPDISLEKIGQIVWCDISFGLMCKNQEQPGRNKLCYDYEIRLLCCDDSIHCKTTTPSATVTTPAVTKTPCIHELCQWTKWYDVNYPQPRLGSGDFETFENITAKGYPICQSPRDVKCRSVSFPDKPLDQLNQKVDCNKQHGLICRNRDQYPPICLNYEIQILCCSDVPCGTTIPTSIMQTTFSASTMCDVQCKWTAWFDVDSPSPGVPGGDFETYNNLITAGKPICRNPKQIQCRAKNFPDISLDKIGQIVRCDISFGLMCKNEEQPGRNKLCYDYEIRLLCCDDSIHCKTTTPSATVTTPAVTSTPCIHELCQWTKWYDVSYPQPRLGSGDFETFEKITAKGYPICQSPKDVKCRSVSFPDKSLDQLNQKVVCNKQHGLICRNRDQYPPICLNYEIQILCCSNVPCGTTIPTSITQTTFSASTMCDVQCKWTAWFNVDSPSPGITGGDYETYNNLIAARKPICRNPEQIQCRAKNFPDVSLDKIGQIVRCDISFGLMCKNQEQPGRNKLCYDYEIRLLCCDDSSHCKTTTPSATVTTPSATVTTPAVTSTPCLCYFSGKLFSLGEVIYNITDTTGCVVYAVCSEKCEAERFLGPCPSTAPTSTERRQEPTTAGYEYQPIPGKCCGECVQVACIIKISNDSTKVLKPGEKWYYPTSNCTYYKCDKIDDHLVTAVMKKTCPIIESEDCESIDPQYRNVLSIEMRAETETTSHSNGVSGHGGDQHDDTSLVHTRETQFAKEEEKMAHKCTCCQELKTSYRQVELYCANGITINYQYNYVESCGCVSNVCVPLETSPDRK
ncbi:mucin-5AC-like [Rhinatrema bivittatum]|uniref:mucin-5AC-like n=1 Tax=Rhinatrema bivittatum TaxID=194408 RepID=UPI00112A7008|nr:mucin-5AC-like [Rhinatrema bivittatum]